jgi:hypothetical protein
LQKYDDKYGKYDDKYGKYDDKYGECSGVMMAQHSNSAAGTCRKSFQGSLPGGCGVDTL